MIYLLAIFIFSFSLVKRREMILLLPVIPLLFSKGFLFLDVNGLPVISFYRVYIFSLIISSIIFFLQNKTRYFRPNLILIKPICFLMATYILVYLANISTPYAGGSALISFFVGVFVPSLLLINLVSELKYETLMKWVKVYMYIYLCVAIYGDVCYLIDFNPFVMIMKSTIINVSVLFHTYGARLRELRDQGTVFHPINFGA